MTTKDLFGVTYTIPVAGSTNWTALNGMISDTCVGLDGIAFLLSSVPILKFVSTSSSIVDTTALTQTHMVHLVAGNGGAVTLSSVTPIVSATYNALLILIGTDTTNSVTIPEGGTNIVLNGEMKLVNGACIVFVFNSGLGKWVELFRNN